MQSVDVGASVVGDVPDVRAVTPTPSETEAMASADASQPTKQPADEPASSAPLKPVFSSDSLITLAAQSSFSGIGVAGAGPAYPAVQLPRLVPDAGGAEPIPLLLSTLPPPPLVPPTGVASAPSSGTGGFGLQALFRKTPSPCFSLGGAEPSAVGRVSFDSINEADVPEELEMEAAPASALPSSASVPTNMSEGLMLMPVETPAELSAGGARESSHHGRPVRSSRGHRRARSEELVNWSSIRRSRESFDGAEGEGESERLGRGRREARQTKRHHAQSPEPDDDDERDRAGRGRAHVNPWTPSEDSRILQGVRENGTSKPPHAGARAAAEASPASLR
jgi:hypothetical protein